MGMEVIAADKLKSLEESIEKPTLDYIKDKASAQGFNIVHVEDLNQMKEQLAKPIEELSKDKGLVAVKEDEYNTLVSNANEPSLELVEQFAGKT